jgi:hypothetical protein
LKRLEDDEQILIKKFLSSTHAGASKGSHAKNVQRPPARNGRTCFRYRQGCLKKICFRIQKCSFHFWGAGEYFGGCAAKGSRRIRIAGKTARGADGGSAEAAQQTVGGHAGITRGAQMIFFIFFVSLTGN